MALRSTKTHRTFPWPRRNRRRLAQPEEREDKKHDDDKADDVDDVVHGIAFP